MPRRSIIQQYLEENDKKVGKYSQAIDAYNAENKAKTDAYNAKAADFNAFMEQVKKGEAYAVANIGMGNMFGGYDPIEEQRKTWPEGMVPAPATPEQQAQEMAYSQYVTQQVQANPDYVAEGDPNAPPLPQTTWVSKDSPEGRATLKALGNQGQFAMITGKNNEAGDLKYVNTDERGFAKDAGSMVNSVAELGAVPRQMGLITVGEKQKWVRNDDGTATRYVAYNGQWAPTGQPIKVAQWNEDMPAAAAMPEQPKFNTLSLREEDELKSPTLDQPGANLAAAHNMPAKTGLVNQMSSGTSAFAERDQQKNIEQSGILARVLSGQIK